MKSTVMAVLVASAGVSCAVAQSNFVVTSFGGNGILTWNAPETGVYSVEWASAPTGAWYKTWEMANMTLGAGLHTNSVPMFYRVTARQSVLLVHGNGPDGSTVFTDESGHAITGTGDVQISTKRSRFGGSSIYFDGSGDYLNAGKTMDWAFEDGDFTVDFWVNFETSPGDTHVIGQHTQGFYTEWCILREGASLKVFINGVPVVGNAWSPQADTWYHIAVTRAAGTLRLFMDGNELGNASTTAVIGSGRPLTIGAASNPSLFLRGYLDEIRILKGIAAWTAPFTPPSNQYAY